MDGYYISKDHRTNTTGKDIRVSDSLVCFYDKEYPNWIITDTRFPNELKAVKDRDGITIRINRPQKGIDNQNTVMLHPSETSLDNAEFDYLINNNGTIKDLVEEIKKVFKDPKIKNELLT